MSTRLVACPDLAIDGVRGWSVATMTRACGVSSRGVIVAGAGGFCAARPVVNNSANATVSRVIRMSASSSHIRLTSRLLIRVAPGGGKVQAQFFGCPARTVSGRITLNPPSFLQRPGVDRVESKLVEQRGHRGLGVAVVTGDDQRAAARGTR